MAERNKPITQLTSEEDIVKAVTYHYDLGMENAKERISIRNRNADIYEGYHYQRLNPLSGEWGRATEFYTDISKLKTQTADIYNNVTSLVPILNRSQPKIMVEAEYPEDVVDIRIEDIEGMLIGGQSDIRGSTAAEKLTDLLENLSERRMDTNLNSTIILESILGGTSFVSFRMSRRTNEIIPYLLEQEQFVGDPDGTRIWDFEDFQYIVITEMWSINKIRQRYGLQESEYGGVPTTQRTGLSRFLPTRKNKTQAESYGMDKYPVRTLYYLEDVPGDDFENIEKMPAMRMFRTINDTKLVVNKSKPFWHKRFPVIAFTSSLNPHKATGISEISQMLWSQLTINILQNTILDNLKMSGSDRIIAEEGAIKGNKISTDPRSVSIANKGKLGDGSIQFIRGFGPDGSIVNLRELMRGDMRDVIGDAGGLFGGNIPSHIKSGKHAQIALHTVLTKQQFKIANLDPSWREMAYQEVSNIQQFIDFDNINLDKLHADKTERLAMSGWLGEAIRNLEYDIKIESKENLPYSIEDRITLGFAMLNSGMMDPEEFYRMTGFRVRPELREEIRKQSQADQFKIGVPLQLQAQAQIQAGVNQQVAEQEFGMAQQAAEQFNMAI